METTKEHFLWIDIAKGILITCIVIGHIDYDNWLYDYFNKLISLFDVSLFFVISGYTLKAERLKKPIDFLKRKLKTLYVPLLAFYIIFTLLHNPLLMGGGIAFPKTILANLLNTIA